MGALEERFWSKVQKTQTCWVWAAFKDKHGYGQFSAGRRSPTGKRVMDMAYRVAFQLIKGPVPAGMHLDHLCRNPSCVNPDHLEAVTSRENTLRGTSPPARYAKMQTCKRGHQKTPENTYYTGMGYGYCRQCHLIRTTANYHKRKAHEKGGEG